ncbi:hypothetical protein LSTR_LSTR016893 [Laodelphax striatellus]|uniref:ATPase dynein-related AAA domain-containing protein n=1 Tax=Laodelphax striatellus TaxID=195883 RepID=A0A482XQS0_LAOST|nr:hypothetical protein LSTR_LSTR016893 [Laodelphax striatellus]
MFLLRQTVEDGQVRFEDSPLVQAVRLGHVLVVDEADKAPTHVTCILKTLVESGDMILSDGRRIRGEAGGGEEVEVERRTQTSQQYGPDVSKKLIQRTGEGFAKLRESRRRRALVLLSVSTREVVNIVKTSTGRGEIQLTAGSVTAVLDVSSPTICQSDEKETHGGGNTWAWVRGRDTLRKPWMLENKDMQNSHEAMPDFLTESQLLLSYTAALLTPQLFILYTLANIFSKKL